MVALGVAEIRIVERARAHEDDGRPLLRLAEYVRAASRAEAPVHGRAAVGFADVVGERARDGDVLGAEGGADAASSAAEILADAAPAIARAERRIRLGCCTAPPRKDIRPQSPFKRLIWFAQASKPRRRPRKSPLLQRGPVRRIACRPNRPTRRAGAGFCRASVAWRSPRTPSCTLRAETRRGYARSKSRIWPNP